MATSYFPRKYILCCFLVCAWGCKKDSIDEPKGIGTSKRDYVWSVDSVYYGNLPGPIQLKSIWGSSTRDVWGVNGDTPDVRDCLWHYDGTRWTRATEGTPITEFTGNKVVYDVWGSARNDVWAVGRKINRDTLSAFIMHYDGISWRDATPPNVYRLESSLYTIHGRAQNDVWVGAYEYALHFDGTEWTAYKVADSLILASISSRDNIVMATSYSPWGRGTQFLHRITVDGFSWIDSTTEIEKKFGVWIWLTDSKVMSFTNGIISNRIDDQGAILPNGWSRELTTATFFGAPFVQEPKNVFASGQFNLLYHYNGIDWKQISISVPNHSVNAQALLGKAWGDGIEVFVCDYNYGIVYHGR